MTQKTTVRLTVCDKLIKLRICSQLAFAQFSGSDIFNVISGHIPRSGQFVQVIWSQRECRQLSLHLKDTIHRFIS